MIYERDYEFLKNKFNEILVPTILMAMSDKVCQLVDIFIISFVLTSSALSIFGLVLPLNYYNGLFYVIFGIGGNLMAVRAKSKFKDEESNLYFTVAILSAIFISSLFVFFIFTFSGPVLNNFLTADLIQPTQTFLYSVCLSYPCICYIQVLSNFARADGFPKLTFYTFLIANILNLLLDIVFLIFLNMGLVGAGLSTTIGFFIGALFMTVILRRNNFSYNLVSVNKLNLKKVLTLIKNIVLNTPEIIGKTFVSTQILIINGLLLTYDGPVGLIAYTIYDNSETIVYMFLSGISKTITPIIALFYKEDDFDAVDFVAKHGLKLLLILVIPFGIVFMTMPEIILTLFSVKDPLQAEYISFIIKITSIGLMGRCIILFTSYYAQAVQFNKIAGTLRFLQEFIIPIGGSLLFLMFIGSFGIWLAILLSEILPLLIYVIYVKYKQKKDKKIKGYFLLEEDDGVHLTLKKDEINETVPKIFNNLNQYNSTHIDKIKSSIISLSQNIFDVQKNIDEIDVFARFHEDKISLILTDDGAIYNPIENNDTNIQKDYMKQINELNGNTTYNKVLGFNRTGLEFAL